MARWLTVICGDLHDVDGCCLEAWSPELQASELRAQLSGYMDGVIRTSIAAHLGAVMSAESVPALYGAVSKLALAVLRHRFSDAATVSLLRRLCAAFIPKACDEGISGVDHYFAERNLGSHACM